MEQLSLSTTLSNRSAFYQVSHANQLRGLELFRAMLDLKKNYAKGYLELFRKHGDCFRFHYRESIVMFFHPESVKQVLKDRAKDLHKSPLYDVLRPLLGNGLVTSEDEEWRNSRRVLAPEFHLRRIESLAPVIQFEIKRLEKNYEEASRTGIARDLATDMMEITFRIAGSAFFGLDVGADAAKTYEAINYVTHFATQEVVKLIQLPEWLPTPARKKSKRYIETLDKIVYGIIDRQAGNVVTSEQSNVLSRLLKNGQLNPDDKLSRLQLRDEVMTMLMAGHETTSNALTWTFLYLMQENAVFKRVSDEIHRVVPGKEIQFSDLSKLTYLEMTLKESLRLKPPVPLVGRTPTVDTEISGLSIKPGEVIELSQYVTHRHPEFWVDPEKFDPERFSSDRTKSHHPFQYFPFAGGPRNCIGEHFAMTEAKMILASLVRRFEFTLANPSVSIEEEPNITLKPKGRVMIKVKERR